MAKVGCAVRLGPAGAGQIVVGVQHPPHRALGIPGGVAQECDDAVQCLVLLSVQNVLGAERSLVLPAGVITAILLFSGNLSAVTIILAILFWSGSFWALVRMGKADPQMSKVYQRHVGYRSYYAARSCIGAQLPGGGSAKV